MQHSNGQAPSRTSVPAGTRAANRASASESGCCCAEVESAAGASAALSCVPHPCTANARNATSQGIPAWVVVMPLLPTQFRVQAAEGGPVYLYRLAGCGPVYASRASSVSSVRKGTHRETAWRRTRCQIQASRSSSKTTLPDPRCRASCDTKCAATTSSTASPSDSNSVISCADVRPSARPSSTSPSSATM